MYHAVKQGATLRQCGAPYSFAIIRGNTMGRTLIFVIGPPSSGKTSFAQWLVERHNYTRFSSDDFRTEEERSKGIYQPAFDRIAEAIKKSNGNVVYDAQSLYWRNRAIRLNEWKDGFSKTMAMVMIRRRESCLQAELARKDRRSEGHRNAVIHMINQAYCGWNSFLTKGWWGYLRQEAWSEIWEVRWGGNPYHFTRRK